MMAFICCSATSGFVLKVSMPVWIRNVANLDSHRWRACKISSVRTGCAAGAIFVGSVLAGAVAHAEDRADVVGASAGGDGGGGAARLEASAYFGLAYYGA